MNSFLPFFQAVYPVKLTKEKVKPSGNALRYELPHFPEIRDPLHKGAELGLPGGLLAVKPSEEFLGVPCLLVVFHLPPDEVLVKLDTLAEEEPDVIDVPGLGPGHDRANLLREDLGLLHYQNGERRHVWI